MDSPLLLKGPKRGTGCFCQVIENGIGNKDSCCYCSGTRVVRPTTAVGEERSME